QDLARLAAEFLTNHSVADFDEAAARGLALLPVDDDVEGRRGAYVVAGSAEDAGRLVDVVHGVALEAAERRGDRLLVVPGQLHRRHVHPLLRGQDRRLLAVVVIRLAVVVGRLDHGQRLRRPGDRGAQELVDRARGAMAPGHGIDYERWALDTVAAGEELGDARVPAGIRLD